MIYPQLELKDWPQEIHPERLKAIEEIGDPAEKYILDIGCSNHKSLPEATGIDIRDCTDIQDNAEELSKILNNVVDFIIARHVFEHLVDQNKALTNWLRVMKTGAKVLFILPDHSVFNTMQESISMGQHFHAYTPESFGNFIKLFPQFRVLKHGTMVSNWSFYYLLEKI